MSFFKNTYATLKNILVGLTALAAVSCSTADKKNSFEAFRENFAKPAISANADAAKTGAQKADSAKTNSQTLDDYLADQEKNTQQDKGPVFGYAQIGTNQGNKYDDASLSFKILGNPGNYWRIIGYGSGTTAKMQEDEETMNVDSTTGYAGIGKYFALGDITLYFETGALSKNDSYEITDNKSTIDLKLRSSGPFAKAGFSIMPSKTSIIASASDSSSGSFSAKDDKDHKLSGDYDRKTLAAMMRQGLIKGLSVIGGVGYNKQTATAEISSGKTKFIDYNSKSWELGPEIEAGKFTIRGMLTGRTEDSNSVKTHYNGQRIELYYAPNKNIRFGLNFGKDDENGNNAGANIKIMF